MQNKPSHPSPLRLPDEVRLVLEGWMDYNVLQEMAQEYPPELKSIHARNMVHILLVFAIPTIAGLWAFYRQEAYSAKDYLQSALTWVFLLGLGSFMITIVYKGLFALPNCPTCHRKMKNIKTIKMTERTIFNLKSTSRWRIVECPHCDKQYRIPGLSQD